MTNIEEVYEEYYLEELFEEDEHLSALFYCLQNWDKSTKGEFISYLEEVGMDEEEKMAYLNKLLAIFSETCETSGSRNEVMEFLLEEGADPNVLDEKNNTALYYSFMEREDKDDIVNIEVKRLLIEKADKEELEEKYGLTPLHLAVIYNDPEKIKKCLLEKDYEILNIEDKFGKTPFDYAFKYRLKDATKLLIEKADKKELEEKYGLTPLHLAVICNDPEKIKGCLLEKDHEILNIKDKFGKTPLYYFSQFKCENVIEALIESKVTIDTLNKEDIHLLFNHIIYKDNEYIKNTVNSLLKAGFDINTKDSVGGSLLYWIATLKSSERDLVYFLIDNGANPYVDCVRKSCYYISDMLKEYGYDSDKIKGRVELAKTKKEKCWEETSKLTQQPHSSISSQKVQSDSKCSYMKDESEKDVKKEPAEVDKMQNKIHTKTSYIGLGL